MNQDNYLKLSLEIDEINKNYEMKKNEIHKKFTGIYSLKFAITKLRFVGYDFHLTNDFNILDKIFNKYSKQETDEIELLNEEATKSISEILQSLN
jgi:hypothetical protein